MRFLRAQVILASTVGALAAAACGRPTLQTDLRPEGPPEVTAVMARSDKVSSNRFGTIVLEPAVYCPATFDPESPTIIGLPNFNVIQVCPDEGEDPLGPVTDADPLNVGVRVVFDELLDPSIETLTEIDPDTGDDTGMPCTADSVNCAGHITSTLPVTINCGQGNVAYDGYYQPNGNNVSWPPGPSIVAIPTEYIAAGATCSVSINDVVVDKTGEQVPAAQRGPWQFTLTPLTLLASDPGDGDVIAVDGAVAVDFNGLLDLASVSAADVTADDGANVPLTFDVDGTTLIITPTSGTWATGVDITVTIPATASIADIGGGAYVPDGDFTVTFQAE